MIQDFAVTQENDGTFDLIINEEAMDFASVEGFETAVDFQLFVDRRTTRTDIAVARERQGWMGDLLTKDEGYEVGSLLYLKRQARDTTVDNAEAAEFARDALNHIVAIGAAREVTAEAVGVNIEGSIVAPDDEVGRFSRLWRATDAS